jgi:hypothetical protein
LDRTGEKSAIVLLLEEAAHGFGSACFYERLRSILGNDTAKRAWRILREGGLAVL